MRGIRAKEGFHCHVVVVVVLAVKSAYRADNEMWHKYKVKRKRREGFHCLCGGGGAGGAGGAGDFEDFKLDKRVHTEEGKRREGFHCHLVVVVVVVGVGREGFHCYFGGGGNYNIETLRCK